MSRLIDADKLNAVLQNMTGHLAENGDALLASSMLYCQEVVEQQCTVDAVQVVRCMECIFAKPPFCTIRKDGFGKTLLVTPIDYCSYGKRMEEHAAEQFPYAIILPGGTDQ